MKNEFFFHNKMYWVVNFCRKPEGRQYDNSDYFILCIYILYGSLLTNNSDSLTIIVETK